MYGTMLSVQLDGCQMSPFKSSRRRSRWSSNNKLVRSDGCFTLDHRLELIRIGRKKA